MFLPLLFKHPLTKKQVYKSLKRYFKWNLFKLVAKEGLTYSLIGNTKINLGKNDTAALVNYYTGLYEFEDMCFLLHFLRKEDFLLDVGANIGVYSLLASGHIGCQSIAFGPIPSTFQKLERNIELNNLEDKITSLNIGIGAANDHLKFTNNKENCLNKVANEIDKDVIEVEVKKLDEFSSTKEKIESILLKVDVEGFETQVLAGAKNLLKNPLLRTIIIELNGAGEKFGFDETALRENLKKEGFSLFYYNPFKRLLSNEPVSYSWGNSIYIRDLDFVNDRIANANNIKVLGKHI